MLWRRIGGLATNGKYNGLIASRAISSKATSILGKSYPTDEWTNISSSILPLIERKLHLHESHPISILRRQIESQFPESVYARYNEYSPVVTTYQNFDSLGFPKDHVGRSKSDTYYVDKDTVLRTHTSAHQAETFRDCPTPGFLISADVYRRDEIDSSHYPVFHQMEGARVFKVHENLVDEIEAEIAAMPRLNVQVEDSNPPNHPVRNPVQAAHVQAHSEAVARHLKKSIEMIAAEVFGKAARASLLHQYSTSSPSSSSSSSFSSTTTATAWSSKDPLRVRWIEAYFPFTSPSWELEVFWNDEWLELCGCGVVQQPILDTVGKRDTVAWAFGLGLERIAMILFGVPDIRLFWSLDPRFLDQFKSGEVVAFREYSKFPSNRKDVSFWVPPTFHENDFMEIVRGVGGDLVETVKKVDEFTNPKTGRKSLCYRINYRSMDRSLSNAEVGHLQNRIVAECEKELGVEIR